MNNINIPLTIRDIYLRVLEPDQSSSPRTLKLLPYDSRRDFLQIGDNLRIAVKLNYTNVRYLETKDMRSVRRHIIISLIDTSSLLTVASASICAYIPSGQDSWANETLIELTLSNNLGYTHHYSVQIQDKKTGIVIGEKELRVFSLLDGPDLITDAFKVASAGVIPELSQVPHIAFKAEVNSRPELFFNIVGKEWINGLPFIPEMELRIHFPNECVHKQFIEPVIDEKEVQKYRVATNFNVPSLRHGIVYAEILCFDIAIAGIVFNVDSATDEEGEWSNRNFHILPEYSLELAEERYYRAINKRRDDEFDEFLDNFIKSQNDMEQGDIFIGEYSNEDREIKNSETETAQYISPLSAIDDLIGLKSVKEKIKSYESLLRFNKMRHDLKLPAIKSSLHAMFMGSPGTGKTTVAKRMGLMLRRAGALSKGHIVIRERSSLLGPHYSNEETNTLEAIEAAQGGILFIDEAYQLYQPNDPRDPGRFVIETLMTALADESKRDWMLILAGYTDEMKQMFEMNPGLKSRIPESNIYVFDDFSESELLEIAERYLDRQGYSLTTQARCTLAQRLNDDYAHRDKTFGNARHVINLIESEILPSMAQRVLSTGIIDNTTLSEVQAVDIPKLSNRYRRRLQIGYRL